MGDATRDGNAATWFLDRHLADAETSIIDALQL